MDTGPRVVDHCKYLMGHTNVVTCVKFLNSGSFLASASFDNFIKIWEVDTGRCVRTLRGHTSAVKSLALTTKAPLILSGSFDQSLRLWDIKTSEQLASYTFHTDRINSVVFVEAEQRAASAGDDKALNVFDPMTGQLVFTLKGHTNSIKSLNWSESRNLLASASADNSVRLWDLTSRRCIKIFNGHKHWVNSVVWGEGHDFLASGSGDHTVKIWSIAAGTLSHTIEGHERFVNSVEWAPERDLLLTGSYDSKIKLWRAGTWELENTYDAHSAEVKCITWDSRFQQFASCSADRSIKLWDCLNPAMLREIEGGRQTCGPIVWIDNNTLAVALRGNELGLFDVVTNQFQSILKKHNSNITSLCYDVSSKILASSDDLGNCIVRNLEDLKSIKFFAYESITTLDLNSGGSVMAVGTIRSELHIENLAAATRISRSFNSVIRCVKWIDQYTLASVNEGGEVSVHNDSNTVLRTSQILKKAKLICLEWCPNINMLAVGNSNGVLRLLDYDTLEIVRRLDGHTDYIGCLVWISSESCLISGSDDKTVRLWDGNSGACIFVYEGHNFPIRGLAYQPTKSLLAVSLELLTLWELSWAKLKGYLWVVRSWRLPKMLIREIARFI